MLMVGTIGDSQKLVHRTREPIYHEQIKDLRIVSVPNGCWQAQRKRSENTQQHSGWLNIGRAGDMQHAFRHMFRAAFEMEQN